MSPRTSQAPCRLTARRRLALGGLIMTSTLAATMLLATPANADTATVTVSDYAALTHALEDGEANIVLDQDIHPDENFSSETVASATDIDLAGHELYLNQLSVGPGGDLTVSDSAGGTNGLTVQAQDVDGASSTSTDPITAVQIADGAEFHVTGATVTANGFRGGAGIGSDDAAGTARFVADGGASVTARGGSVATQVGPPLNFTSYSDGGAGIGGSSGQHGIDVTVGAAAVSALGGAGAAGIGGGAGGAGGALTLLGAQSHVVQDAASSGIGRAPASFIGAGQGSDLDFGTLTIGAQAYLSVLADDRLVLTGDDDIENDGTLAVAKPHEGYGVIGTGVIHNLGTVSTYDDGPVDPDTVLGAGVKVTGYNYQVDLDANGGSIDGSTSAHLLSGSVTDVVRDSDVTAPDGTSFWKWNTASDGSGTDVVTDYGQHPDLVALGTSTGTPVPAKLFARFAHAVTSTKDDLPDAIVGTPYDQAVPVTGDGITGYELQGGLPAGLSLDASTGRITGTPTEASTTTVQIAVDAVAGNVFGFNLAVGGKPVFGTTTLPKGQVGDDYSAAVQVSGNDDTSYALAGGALPAGLTLDGSGTISGSPTTGGTSSFTVRATNRFGSTDQAFTLAVAAVAVAPAGPVLNTVPKKSVKFGHELTLAVTASSTLPVTYRIDYGSLPKGVKLDGRTGLITGAPAESGTFTVVIAAKSTAGTASTVVVISVSKLDELLDTKNDVPAVKVGAASVPLKVAGFKKGEHYTVRVDGKLVHRGTMKKAGTLSVSVHLAKAKTDTVHTIRIAGSRAITDPAKSASTTVVVTSLAAKKKLRVLAVTDQRGVKLVAVEKVAAGEAVVVTDHGKVIAKGHASAYGIFTFPQSKAGSGRSVLKIHGATAKRAATVTVKNAKP